MEKGKEISYLINNMKKTNETINHYGELYEDLKKAKNSWSLTLNGNVNYEDIVGNYKSKYINLRIDGDLKEKVIGTIENYYQVKIRENMKKLCELQETLKSL